MSHQKILESKPYYDVLDGLRGTAAIVILVFHYLEMIYPEEYSENFMGHGFLAVDFFFCLSGFVTGFAYDNRIKTIGIKSFFVNRLIRLHPLVVLGSIIGFAGFVLNPFVDGIREAGWGNLLPALACSMLLIPAPFLPLRGGGLFPYNTPSWSLFLEYIANVVYALVLCRIKKPALPVLGCICAVWLMYTSCKAGWLINGWDIKTIGDGFPRVGYSFTAGLLIFRYRLILRNRMGFVLPFILLMSVFMYPHVNNDWFTEALMVIAVFPLIISIGAGADATGRMKKFCIFIGKLSYPLYMTHITTVWIFGDYYCKAKPQGMELVGLVACLCLFNLVFAYAVMRLYDEPVRAWLTQKANRLKTLRNSLNKQR
ncbi:MAG: acyltransferase [Bacteroidales bacterium]|jgi:peptidoglycan/LPS O-acetylase OafA/YrhL|nr:acyltransferase [Bacteroidales bacterium]